MQRTTALIFCAICLLATARVQTSGAQSGGAGGILAKSSARNILVVDGAAFATLGSALAACPPGGCVIYDGVPETFASNPFAALPRDTFAEVHLLRETWTANATIVVPTKSQLYGSGRGDANAVGTVIQAGPAFPASTPVIAMGDVRPAYAVRIENLTVDCQNRPGAIGIQNLNSQEQSSVRHALIVNCPASSLDVETSAAQNSGPYEDLELLDDTDCTLCSAQTVPIVVNNVPSFRGIHGATVNSDGAATEPAAGAEIDSAGSYSDLHFEHVAAAVVIGSRRATGGVVISNVYCSVPNTDCVTISNAFPNQNISAIAIASNGTNLITDQRTGNTLTVKAEGGSIAIYAIGNGANPPVLTTSAGHRLSAALVTTAATRDRVKIPGMTASGHCTLTPTDAAAAADIAATYVSAKTKGEITIAHPPRASRTWDIQCTAN